MKMLRNMLALAGCVTVLALSSGNVAAQGRGNFDPAQMRQRMMDGIREQMDVKDDAEWKVLETSIGKVMDARQEIGTGGSMRALFGRRNRGGDTAGGDTANNNNNGGDQNGRRNRGGPGGPGGFGQPNAEQEALQKALDAKAPADEIKSKLAKLRDATKAREAKLESAQEDLRKLLSSRQEATAVLLGLLK